MKKDTTKTAKPAATPATKKAVEKIVQAVASIATADNQTQKVVVSDLVKDAFDRHPTANEVYETTDGYLFFKDGDAQLHARSLELKNITLHLRSNVISPAAVISVPAITKVQMHEGSQPGTNSKGVTAGEIILPLSDEVKEQLPVATNANGEAITSTEQFVENPGEHSIPETGKETKKVETPEGEPAANSNVNTETK